MVIELHLIVETAPFTGGANGTLAFESPDVIAASRAMLKALAETSPPGCTVVADHAKGTDVEMRGVRERSIGRGRAELGRQWHWGQNAGYPRGLVHSASLLAPLTKHDRRDDQHQVVVTVWDLRPWLDPAQLPSDWVSWQRAMLKRAAKHADAVVVPSHALANALEEIAPVRDRIRVLPVGIDEAFTARSVDAATEDRAVVVGDTVGRTAPAVRAALAAGLDVDVLDCVDPAGLRSALQQEGADLGRVVINDQLDAAARAGLLTATAVFINASNAPVWPWRVIEALRVGVPIVTTPSVHVEDAVADAAIVAPADELQAAIVRASTTEARKLSVLAHDRAASFAWRAAAEQIWALHADL